MKELIDDIIHKGSLSPDKICQLLSATGEEQKELHRAANNVAVTYRGNIVYYRGLIEFSNICIKNCYYCGIRKENKDVVRYDIDEAEILAAARYALNNRFGSVVLQSGERTDTAFVEKINRLITKIKEESNGRLGITLSLGEQTEATYQRWFNSGAHRYLLRIETSDARLYQSLHPDDELHRFSNRLDALNNLKKIGYQTGTGVMIGLPGQTLANLADDLLYIKNTDVDMVGMGPYIEHDNTPLTAQKKHLWPLEVRFNTALNMVAVLRLMMPDINIAAATALQAIDPMGREKALKAGANIIMPNITPTENRKHYLLYDNKPCTDESADDCLSCLNMRISLVGKETGWDEWGDSPHYFKRCEKSPPH